MFGDPATTSWLHTFQDGNMLLPELEGALAKKLHTESGFEVNNDLVWNSTPSYVAPEAIQALSCRYGFGVDLWSSGVVLYICLCGRPPFSDDLHTEESPCTLAEQIKMGQYYYPSPYWDSVGDPALDLNSMLTVDVDKRATAWECLSHPLVCQESSISPDGEKMLYGSSSGHVDVKANAETGPR
ncbi:serine/threonine-protein kinase chk2 (cds1) [Aspergillus udagawae]|nr:serine/threonine-protein kinase chk2 (cds1) [Aspergillus udagawae]